MFHRDSRWDRSTPAAVHPGGRARPLGGDPLPSGAEGEALNEPIAVEAFFRAGRVLPKRFQWRERVYDVERVTYRWTDREGIALRHHFSVMCGGTLYQLSFDNQRLGWRLVQTQAADA